MTDDHIDHHGWLIIHLILFTGKGKTKQTDEEDKENHPTEDVIDSLKYLNIQEDYRVKSQKMNNNQFGGMTGTADDVVIKERWKNIQADKLSLKTVTSKMNDCAEKHNKEKLPCEINSCTMKPSQRQIFSERDNVLARFESLCLSQKENKVDTDTKVPKKSIKNKKKLKSLEISFSDDDDIEDFLSDVQRLPSSQPVKSEILGGINLTHGQNCGSSLLRDDFRLPATQDSYFQKQYNSNRLLTSENDDNDDTEILPLSQRIKLRALTSSVKTKSKTLVMENIEKFTKEKKQKDSTGENGDNSIVSVCNSQIDRLGRLSVKFRRGDKSAAHQQKAKSGDTIVKTALVASQSYAMSELDIDLDKNCDHALNCTKFDDPMISQKLSQHPNITADTIPDMSIDTSLDLFENTKIHNEITFTPSIAHMTDMSQMFMDVDTPCSIGQQNTTKVTSSLSTPFTSKRSTSSIENRSSQSKQLTYSTDSTLLIISTGSTENKGTESKRSTSCNSEKNVSELKRSTGSTESRGSEHVHKSSNDLCDSNERDSQVSQDNNDTVIDRNNVAITMANGDITLWNVSQMGDFKLDFSLLSNSSLLSDCTQQDQSIQDFIRRPQNKSVSSGSSLGRSKGSLHNKSSRIVQNNMDILQGREEHETMSQTAEEMPDNDLVGVDTVSSDADDEVFMDPLANSMSTPERKAILMSLSEFSDQSVYKSHHMPRIGGQLLKKKSLFKEMADEPKLNQVISCEDLLDSDEEISQLNSRFDLNTLVVHKPFSPEIPVNLKLNEIKAIDYDVPKGSPLSLADRLKLRMSQSKELYVLESLSQQSYSNR